jgi:hypothetical protein
VVLAKERLQSGSAAAQVGQAPASRATAAEASPDPDRPGARRPELPVTASARLCFRTVAYLASMTTCWLSWSAAVSCAEEPILEASMEMAGKLAPGRQSGHGVNVGAGVCYQVARFGGLPPGLPHARLGGRGAIAGAFGLRAG